MADFNDAQIQEVWDKGIKTDKDVNKYRKDFADAWIVRDKYGVQEEYGWSIDHVYPEAKGGDENIDNLHPMHWENNLSKSNDYPTYSIVKTSEGNKNIVVEEQRTVNDNLQKKLKTLYDIK